MSREETPMFEPRRRGIWFKLLAALCVLVVIVAGWLFLERVRGQAALKKYEKELIAKGEKLTYSEIRSKPQDIQSRDRAIQLVAACGGLQTGAVLIANAPPADKTIGSNRVLVITRESAWADAKKRLHTWEQVREDLERNRELLDEMRGLVRSPQFSYPINYRGFSTLMPHLAAIRKGGQWLSASSLYHLHVGEAEKAIDDIETILLLARILEEEPFIISQLVRITAVTMAIQSCWQLLQHENLQDAQLVRVQKLFGELDFAPGMIRGLQADRAAGREMVQSMRAGELSFSAITGAGAGFYSDDDLPPALEKIPYGEELQEGIRAVLVYPMWRSVFSYGDERHLLEEIQTLIDATRESAGSRSSAKLQSTTEALDKTIQKELRSVRRLTAALFVQSITSSAMRSFRAQTHCQMTTTAIALKRHHLRHHKYPSSLSELVPEFLSELPIDYVEGAPLRYRAEDGGFLLWSVGNNKTDDEGNPIDRRRYWLQVGKDAVWPQPASEAEVSDYRESQLKR